MLKKNINWIGIALVSLIVIVVVIIGVLYIIGYARLARKYDIQPEIVSISTDAASIQQGQHWAKTLCSHCHGEDFSGVVLIKDSTVGYIPALNLTSGDGGAVSEFTHADWVRALRHGVDPEGRALVGMTSQNYYYLSDKDLGILISYLKSVPPVNHEMGEPAISSMAKILLAAGMFGENILPAESITHSSTCPPAVYPGTTTQYGEYIVRLFGHWGRSHPAWSRFGRIGA